MGSAPSCNDTGNITSCNSSLHQHAVAGSRVWILAVTYGFIPMLAVFGNLLVVIVVVRSKRMQTVTNIFITNVAIADILTGLISVPLQLHAAIMQVWVLPRFMCSVLPTLLVLSVSISVFTLAVIAVDRFFAVVYPLKPGITKFTAKVIIGTIWTIGVCSSTPTAIFYRVQNDDSDGQEYCDAAWPLDNEFGKVYHIYLFTAQYLLPLSVIVVAYTTICFRIWLTKAPGDAMDRRDEIMNRNKRKVVKMLIIVVCLFVLCWLPLQIYNLVAAVYPPINKLEYIHIIWFISNWLAMSNSCHNPFIYGLLNEKFKSEFRRVFACVCRCCVRSTPTSQGNGHDMNSLYASDDGKSNDKTRRHIVKRKPRFTVCESTVQSYV